MGGCVTGGAPLDGGSWSRQGEAPVPVRLRRVGRCVPLPQLATVRDTRAQAHARGSSRVLRPGGIFVLGDSSAGPLEFRHTTT